MGVMFDIFHSAGTTPALKERLNRLVSELKMARFVSQIMVVDLSPRCRVAGTHLEHLDTE